MELTTQSSLRKDQGTTASTRVKAEFKLGFQGSRVEGGPGMNSAGGEGLMPLALVGCSHQNEA